MQSYHVSITHPLTLGNKTDHRLGVDVARNSAISVVLDGRLVSVLT